MKKGNGKKSTNSIVVQYPVICLVAALLILFQIIWNFYMHEPYRGVDITTETVQTILREGYQYQVNPMTGAPYTVGVPTRLKILVLPYVYASICKVTGVSPQTLLYEWVPMLVLLLSYFVYSRWAVYLFPENQKKQCIFMLLVVLAYQFGSYTSITDSFLVFHSGYEGAAIRAAVLLPLALLFCLKGKWISAAICAAVELCIVWTTYGLGYVALIMAVVAACKLARRNFEKRRAA